MACTIFIPSYAMDHPAPDDSQQAYECKLITKMHLGHDSLDFRFIGRYWAIIATNNGLYLYQVNDSFYISFEQHLLKVDLSSSEQSIQLATNKSQYSLVMPNGIIYFSWPLQIGCGHTTTTPPRKKNNLPVHQSSCFKNSILFTAEDNILSRRTTCGSTSITGSIDTPCNYIQFDNIQYIKQLEYFKKLNCLVALVVNNAGSDEIAVLYNFDDKIGMPLQYYPSYTSDHPIEKFFVHPKNNIVALVLHEQLIIGSLVEASLSLSLFLSLPLRTPIAHLSFSSSAQNNMLIQYKDSALVDIIKTSEKIPTIELDTPVKFSGFVPQEDGIFYTVDEEGYISLHKLKNINKKQTSED